MNKWQQNPLWKMGHLIYENNFLRKLISPMVNFFKPEWVMVGNNKMYIDKDDRVVSAKLLLDGVWEEYETELFKKIIKSGDIVLDIGANIGYHTLIAAELVGPNGKVFAFEPSPRNFKLLKRNVGTNNYKNVVLVQKALSNKNGLLKLFLSTEDNYGDLRIFDSRDARESISIKTISLDSFFKKKNNKINVIKMDVQGSESLVLKGAKATFNKNRNLKMFTEFWPKALLQSESSAAEYLSLLKKYGFKIYDIDSSNKKIKIISTKDLISNYPKDSIYNADLFCVKK